MYLCSRQEFLDIYYVCAVHNTRNLHIALATELHVQVYIHLG